MKLRFGIWDLVVVALVLVLAVVVFALFLPGDRGGYALVYQDGQLIKTVSLSEDQVFLVSGRYIATVTVQDGKIAVTESNCPGGDCLRCGWLDSVGRSVVCLPNGLEIRVEAATGSVDFVVR